MTAIHIHRRIDSETLHLPELRPLLGQDVEIVVTPARPRATEKDWEATLAAVDSDRIDPELYKQYREFDRQHNVPPAL